KSLTATGLSAWAAVIEIMAAKIHPKVFFMRAECYSLGSSPVQSRYCVYPRLLHSGCCWRSAPN
ncbi:MAG TPA: hypothetical protein VN673_04140, partial [Clostridia bacterium]|nr:hypothetical protein [Clostridia bacterium]